MSRGRSRNVGASQRVGTGVALIERMQFSTLHFDVPGKGVLVAYASAHGSTKGIAKAIGDKLVEAGLHADVRPIDEIGAIDAYDAVVLGSAIHNGRWLSEAAAFARSRASELAIHPVWLFSVSSVGETSSVFGPRLSRFMRRMRKETKEIAALREAIRARDHRNFAGAIQRDHWGFAGDLFLKAFGGTYGDHRDWQDVDAWADGIARSVRAMQAAHARSECA